MADAHHGSRIDVHHHFYSPEYLAVMGEMGKRPIVHDWTVGRSLEEMDKNGIASAVLSLSPPGATLASLDLRYLQPARVGPAVAVAEVRHGLGRVEVCDEGNENRLCVAATARTFEP